jgi:putative permease
MPDNSVKVKVVNLHMLVLWALGIYLLVRFLDAIAITILFFTLAVVLAIALDGPVSWLQARGMSRGFSVASFALLLLIVLGTGIYYGSPVLMKQTRDTLGHIPEYTAGLQKQADHFTKSYPELKKYIGEINFQQRLKEMGQTALPRIGRFSVDVLSGAIAFLLLLAVTFYTVAEPAPLVRGALRLLPRPQRPKGIRIYRRVLSQLQTWAKATFWLMLIIGTLSGLGLWLIGAPNPLLFAILAGLGEAVPVVGPIISCIPPFLVMLSISPIKALWVIALFILIQQIEGNVLVPRIMAKAMKLHPVPVLFCVVAMGTLTGPIGLLLAIPLFAIVKIVYEETYLRRISPKYASAVSENEIKSTEAGKTDSKAEEQTKEVKAVK